MESVLTKKQTKKFTKTYTQNGTEYRITATVRYDNECGNGHNTFAITGEIDRKNSRGVWVDDCSGCIHDEIAKHFPALAPLIKWHLFDANGPMHYLANTIYHAGDRDCWKGKKGEVRFYRYNIIAPNGKPVFVVKNHVSELPEETEAKEIAARIDGQIVPVPWILYEGKERDFKAAREAAVWPDATDEELSAEPEVLRQKLIDRLPALIAEFKKAIEDFGFVY